MSVQFSCCTCTCAIWLGTMIIGYFCGSVLAASGFDLQVIKYSNSSFVLYWIEPTAYEDVNLYQVKYNVSSVYDTDYGERMFTDQLVMLQKFAYVELPLYTKNSLYSVQVIAFTASNERIASEITSFHSLDFDSAGLNDAITYFQLRFVLPLDCSTWINKLEYMQNTVFSIRLAMVIGIHSTCWEEALNNEKCNFPATNVLEETLKCQQSNKVIYQGRIIGTRNASPGVILDYIKKWILFSTDDFAISIKDDDNVYDLRVDKTCPSYLPSPKDSNCTPDLNNTITTSDVMSLMAIILVILLIIMLTVTHFIKALKYNEIHSIHNHNYKLNKC